MNLISRSMFSLAAVAVLVPAGTCWGHGSSTISIHVGTSGGNLDVFGGTTANGVQVFADNFEKFDGLGQTIVPGWGIDSGLASSTLRLRILDELLYWDTTSGLAATTSDSLILRRLYFPSTPDSAEVSQSSIVDPETLLWDSATVGQSHHIMRYDVPAGGPAGAYGVMLQVEDVSGTLGNSDPFLLVFNKGLTNTPGSSPGQPFDGSEFGQAITAMSLAVPEPGTLTLAAILALCGVPYCWRRRRAAQ